MVQEQGGEKETKIPLIKQQDLPKKIESEQTLPQKVRKLLQEVIGSLANRISWLTPAEQTRVAQKLQETGQVEEIESLEREKFVLAERLNHGMSTLIGEKVFTDEELLQIAADSLYFNFVYSEDFKHIRHVPQELGNSFRKAGERISKKIPLSQNQIEKVFNLRIGLQNAETIVNENYNTLDGTWKMLEYNKQKRELGKPTIPEHDLNQDVLRLLRDKSIQLAFEKVQTEKKIDHTKSVRASEAELHSKEIQKAKDTIENAEGNLKIFYGILQYVANGKIKFDELAKNITELGISTKDWDSDLNHPVRIMLKTLENAPGNGYRRVIDTFKQAIQRPKK